MKIENFSWKLLSFIQEILNITDTQFFTKLEKFMKAEKTKIEDKKPTSMSMDDFYDMIDQSLQDSKEGKVISTEELKNKVRQWY